MKVLKHIVQQLYALRSLHIYCNRESYYYMIKFKRLVNEKSFITTSSQQIDSCKSLRLTSDCLMTLQKCI